jgi:hypothetical protein
MSIIPRDVHFLQGYIFVFFYGKVAYREYLSHYRMVTLIIEWQNKEYINNYNFKYLNLTAQMRGPSC